MLIGVPKEVKSHEYRVGLTPGSVRELVFHGHEVIVEAGSGVGIGFDDASYEAVGAGTLASAAEVFAAAELVVKVKEPQPHEVAALRQGQILFTYLHLAADKLLTDGLMRSGAIAIAYETVTDARGGLPLLAPMSEVAGRMAKVAELSMGARGRAGSRRDRKTFATFQPRPSHAGQNSERGSEACPRPAGDGDCRSRDIDLRGRAGAANDRLRAESGVRK